MMQISGHNYPQLQSSSWAAATYVTQYDFLTQVALKSTDFNPTALSADAFDKKRYGYQISELKV